VRQRFGRANDAPHQEQELREASTDSDAFKEGSAVEDARDDSDPRMTGAVIVLDGADDPAGPDDCGVAAVWISSDGAALASSATLVPNWAKIAAVGTEGPLACTPGHSRSVSQQTPADQAPVAVSPS
jgi:hypothetical protein